jgi:hypothetical protein
MLIQKNCLASIPYWIREWHWHMIEATKTMRACAVQFSFATLKKASIISSLSSRQGQEHSKHVLYRFNLLD